MIYIISILLWFVMVTVSPVFTLFLTGLILLYLFPSAGTNCTRTESICSPRVANMETKDLERHIVLRKAAEAAKDWDGTSFDPAESYYGRQIEELIKPEAKDDPELKRLQAEISAHINKNIEEENTKREKEYLRKVEMEQRREKLLEKRNSARKIIKDQR